MCAASLVEVAGATVHFPAGRRGLWGGERLVAQAVDAVSLTIEAGETLGLVGESGSGKSTLGRAILRRLPLVAGRIFFRGEDITEVRGKALRGLSRHMQMVFQDPYASLNPRQRIGQAIAEPLVVHGLVRSARQAAERVAELLRQVGLPEDAAGRYPHAFSGGQRQRIGIARALALKPEFIVADEPVSALDVSIRAQVVNLLMDLQGQYGLTTLFIAHDLAVVRQISHRIAIMFAGRLAEVADRDSLYENPRHPYTEALLSAIPLPDPRARHDRRVPLSGERPDPMHPLPGCRYQTRCPLADGECRQNQPPLRERTAGHWVACWHR